MAGINLLSKIENRKERCYGGGRSGSAHLNNRHRAACPKCLQVLASSPDSLVR